MVCFTISYGTAKETEGGLKMIDIGSFNRSLKSIWIKKYLDTENQGVGKVFLTLNLGNMEAKPL